jgi:hypothetical protein
MMHQKQQKIKLARKEYGDEEYQPQQHSLPRAAQLPSPGHSYADEPTKKMLRIKGLQNKHISLSDRSDEENSPGQ